MRVHSSWAILLTLLICRSARSDTITMKDNLSVNCSVVGMSNGVLTVKAQFSSKEKDVQIPIRDVQSIEFNLLTSNPGPPPKVLGIGPPADLPLTGAVIVLRGGGRESCDLVSIDAARVHCNPNDKTRGRSTILRIVFGSQ